MRIAIVGSRPSWDGEGAAARMTPETLTRMNEVLKLVSLLPEDALVISGGADGVDTWAETAARKRGLRTLVIHPNYAAFGRRASLVRNAEIVERCEMLVAFWDGKSRGTADAIAKARAAHKGLVVIGPDGEQMP